MKPATLFKKPQHSNFGLSMQFYMLLVGTKGRKNFLSPIYSQKYIIRRCLFPLQIGNNFESRYK